MRSHRNESNKFLCPQYFHYYCYSFLPVLNVYNIYIHFYSGHQGQLFQSGEALNVLLLFMVFFSSSSIIVQFVDDVYFSYLTFVTIQWT